MNPGLVLKGQKVRDEITHKLVAQTRVSYIVKDFCRTDFKFRLIYENNCTELHRPNSILSSF